MTRCITAADASPAGSARSGCGPAAGNGLVLRPPNPPQVIFGGPPGGKTEKQQQEKKEEDGSRQRHLRLLIITGSN